jgi:2,3-bisphosphoglycerate-independent phosphoglycerate mutase
MRLFLCFIDGVGLGPDDPAVNPLAAARMPHLRGLLGGRPLTREAVPYSVPGVAVIATDPRLGMPGLPQSATGQTAIFTGQNGAQAIGRHLNAYPTPSLVAILQEHSIFKQVKAAGGTGTFLNAFRPEFFQWVAEGQPRHADRRYRSSASTVAALAAGLEPFRTLEQLRAGEAVAFDIDHSVLRALGYDLEPVDPAEAGRRAAVIAGQNHFTLYEHFLTDKAGHSRDRAYAIETLERLDAFLGGVLAHLPPDVLLLITSDHGNIEDVTVKPHTLNDVATILVGPGAEAAAAQIHSLTDITPALLNALRSSRATAAD